METITLKPIEIFFCNANDDMGLTGHCHFAQVTIVFESLAPIGFPSFNMTYAELGKMIRDLKLKPVRGTNEDVARMIMAAVEAYAYPSTTAFKGLWRVYGLTLDVMGVQDENNHSDGFTRYTITREQLTPAQRGAVLSTYLNHPTKFGSVPVPERFHVINTTINTHPA